MIPDSFTLRKAARIARVLVSVAVAYGLGYLTHWVAVHP